MDLVVERVAMNAERPGAQREVTLVLLNRREDELLLELAIRLPQTDAAVDQIGDQLLQSGPHASLPRPAVSRINTDDGMAGSYHTNRMAFSAAHDRPSQYPERLPVRMRRR